MTTQRKVMEAFLDGDNSPRRASNLQIMTIHGGTKAFLVGGYGGERRPGAVYAVRKPIKQLAVYSDFRWSTHHRQVCCASYATAGQYHKFNRILHGYRNEYDITELSGSGYSDKRRPATTDFDRLHEELHG